MKRFSVAFFGVIFIISCSTSGQAVKDVVTLSGDDEKLFTEVQRATFQYFWEGAEPVSGLARERFHADNVYPQNDKNIVTSGGGGFGMMAILAGINRGFITRAQGLERLERIVKFLETADRFHGVWPHWWNGETGKVKPFSRRDNGGDLVETSFMVQGLLCARQYFQNGSAREKQLAQRMDKLWKEVEFDWYRNGKNVLYWHWSPEYDWQMNFPVRGYNECLIMYVLAASSPTHGVPAEVYHEGWAENGKIMETPPAYGGYKLQFRQQGDAVNGGPLFWAHYSYLALDPRGLKDKYGDYWENNRNHALINYQWCVDNPKKFKGYGPNSWGLTSSYSMRGYAGHAPSEKRDLGVISPTAALSSFPYTPQQSMAAMKHWYNNMKDKLWGPYGFYDAFSETAEWYTPRYLAIDQGPIVVMMENYRSGLLWDLFMSCPEIKDGLSKLGFQSSRLDVSLYRKEYYIKNNDTLPYRILLPQNNDPGKKYPLILFLHGAGERGSNNESQLAHGAKLFLNDTIRANYPAIVVFPQCPSNSYWSNVNIVTDSATKKRTFNFRADGDPTQAMKSLLGLLEKLKQEYKLDKDHLYVGGLSMGGMGTFELVRRKPKMFAAAFAICGGADPATAKKITNTSWWIFHGLKDNVVDPEFSQQMAAALKEHRADVKLTLYPDANHNSWDAAFAEKELLSWLFSKKR